MKHRVTNIKITATILSEDAGGVKNEIVITDYPTNVSHISPTLRELLIESTLPNTDGEDLTKEYWGV